MNAFGCTNAEISFLPVLRNRIFQKSQIRLSVRSNRFQHLRRKRHHLIPHHICRSHSIHLHLRIIVLEIRVLIPTSVILLTSIHILEIVENPFVFYWLFRVYIKHLFCSLGVYQITIFGDNNLLPLYIIQFGKMGIIDILDINPFYFEVIFELVGKIIPPIWKGVFTEPWHKTCDSLEHSTFDNAEEKINLISLWKGL